MSSEETLDIDLEDIPDLVVLPNGEYEVVLLHVERKLSTNDNLMLSIRLETTQHQDCDTLYHHIMLPMEGMPQKQVNRNKRSLKDFMDAFGFDKDTRYEDMEGTVGWAMLATDKDQEEKDRNVVKYFQPATA